MGEERKDGLGEQARALKEDLSPAKVEQKLEQVVEERPKARHLLDFSIVAKALVAAVVVAVILLILASPQLAAIALVVVFVGGWLLLAQLSYDRRRETHDAGSAEPEEGGSRGEREAPSRNGSDPDRQRTTG